MSSLDRFRDADLIKRVVEQIHDVPLSRPVCFMEVCGGHTAAIYRYALRDLLPEKVSLLSGPGCPVCVTPNGFIDQAIALANQQNVTLATFGDLVRVPGSYQTLADARAEGSDVRVFYSSADALEYALSQPEKIVVFLGIGFETTACTIAATMADAIDRDVRNFKLLSALKTMPEALRVLLTSPDVWIDGLILPGHVTTVTGTSVFEFIADEFEIPCCVSGFEPLDILETIHALCLQSVNEQAIVENHYERVVRSNGNPIAQQFMTRVFEEAGFEWRGLGMIEHSGLKLKPEYSEWDAGLIPINLPPVQEKRSCRCGEVLRGTLHPTECRMFGRACTPDTPNGACMVSAEGACAAVYHYQANHER